MEKADKGIQLTTLVNNWELMDEAISTNIHYLESLIFSVSAEDNEVKYTAKDINIARREILVKLKNLPKKMLEQFKIEGTTFNEEDVLKEMIMEDFI